GGIGAAYKEVLRGALPAVRGRGDLYRLGQFDGVAVVPRIELHRDGIGPGGAEQVPRFELPGGILSAALRVPAIPVRLVGLQGRGYGKKGCFPPAKILRLDRIFKPIGDKGRSEERRVGKEV